MVILEALRIFGPDSIPAVDFTGNQWDNDVVSTKGLNTSAIDEVTMGFKWPPLPIFSPVRQPGKTVDIPFPGRPPDRLGMSSKQSVRTLLTLIELLSHTVFSSWRF
jgi:hypothetical protein